MATLEQRMLVDEDYEPSSLFPRMVERVNRRDLRVCAMLAGETYLHKMAIRLLVEDAVAPAQVTRIYRKDKTNPEVIARVVELNQAGYRVCTFSVCNYRGTPYSLYVLEKVA